MADPPTVLQAPLHNLKHNQVLRPRKLRPTVRLLEQPTVAEGERGQVEALGDGFWRITLDFGVMESPDVPRAVQRRATPDLVLEPMATSHYLGRATIVPAPGGGRPRWRERLRDTNSPGHALPGGSGRCRGGHRHAPPCAALSSVVPVLIALRSSGAGGHQRDAWRRHPPHDASRPRARPARLRRRGGARAGLALAAACAQPDAVRADAAGAAAWRTPR